MEFCGWLVHIHKGPSTGHLYRVSLIVDSALKSGHNKSFFWFSMIRKREILIEIRGQLAMPLVFNSKKKGILVWYWSFLVHGRKLEKAIYVHGPKIHIMLMKWIWVMLATKLSKFSICFIFFSFSFFLFKIANLLPKFSKSIRWLNLNFHIVNLIFIFVLIIVATFSIQLGRRKIKF